jgi:nucleoside triphosphate pyrophosphatase
MSPMSMDERATQPGDLSDEPPALVLASASPRRRSLLWQIGVPHRVVVADIDERVLPGEAPEDCVQRLALAKARAPRGEVLPVLGADTAVVLDGDMLGKPRDRDSALALLARLSGRTHRVLTAVALVSASGHGLALSESEVDFRALSADECARYWASGEPRDKAGGYAIQGLGAVFVSALRGSYSGVMGLPLYETATLLAAAGVACWRRAPRSSGDTARVS